MVRHIFENLLWAAVVALLAVLLWYAVSTLVGCQPDWWADRFGQNVPPILPANTPTATATR